MKKITLSLCVLFAMAMFSVPAHADFFDNMKNFHLIWLDADTEVEYDITKKIVQDLRIDDVNTKLYVWDNTYTFPGASGKGYFGQIGGFHSVAVATGSTWSGLGFCLVDESAKEVNLTTLTDDYVFHMAYKSNNDRAHQIQVFGGKETQARFAIGVGTQGDEKPENVTPTFEKGKWQLLELSVARLKELGFQNRAAFKGNYFVTLSGAANNDLMLDGVFFYQPASSGIDNTTNDDKLDVLVTASFIEVFNPLGTLELYNLAGLKVRSTNEKIMDIEDLTKGIYILKSGNVTKKVVVK